MNPFGKFRLTNALALALCLTCNAAPHAQPGAASDQRVALIAQRFTQSFELTQMLPRELLAPTIHVWHLPAIEGDPEVIPKEQFGRDDRTALLKAMPDMRMEVLSTVTGVKGFTIQLKLSGTRANAAKFSTRINLRFIVADGIVTGMEAQQDPAERQLLGEIAREGGYQAPAAGASDGSGR